MRIRTLHHGKTIDELEETLPPMREERLGLSFQLGLLVEVLQETRYVICIINNFTYVYICKNIYIHKYDMYENDVYVMFNVESTLSLSVYR